MHKLHLVNTSEARLVELVQQLFPLFGQRGLKKWRLVGAAIGVVVGALLCNMMRGVLNNKRGHASTTYVHTYIRMRTRLLWHTIATIITYILVNSMQYDAVGYGRSCVGT